MKKTRNQCEELAVSARGWRQVLATCDAMAFEERVNVHALGKPPSLDPEWWQAYGEIRRDWALTERKLTKAREAKRGR